MRSLQSDQLKKLSNFKKYDMKIIRNNIIPFSGYKAIKLFGVLFVRGNARIDDITLNHEKIHTAQIKEMLYVFFYVWYIIEWLIRLPFGNAYRNISFEREAYDNQDDLSYLKNRKRFDFVRFIKKTRVC
jgi:hypothetical protein